MSQTTHSKILKIALPMVASNATIPLLGAVDTSVIGQLGDPTLLASVGLGAVVISTIYWIFGFLRMSTTGLVAQTRGVTDDNREFCILIRGVLIGFVGGTLLILLQTPLFHLAIKLFQALPEVESQAQNYLSIRIWSAPPVICNYAVLGWLIALERTLSVFYLQVFINVLNIILDLVFVLHLNLGIQGVAFASLIAETSGAFLGAIIARNLYKKKGNPRIRELFLISEWNKLFFTNANILIRSLALEIVILSYVFFGSLHGTVTLASNYILLQFVHISSYSLDGFAFSAEVLVGKAYGEKSKSKIRTAAVKSTFWASGCAILLTLFFYAFGEKLINLIVKDELVQIAAKDNLFLMSITPLCGFLSFMLDGIFIGATQTHFMRKAMFQSVAIYFSFVIFLIPVFGNQGLWFCINIFFVARAICLLRYYPTLESLSQK